MTKIIAGNYCHDYIIFCLQVQLQVLVKVTNFFFLYSIFFNLILVCFITRFITIEELENALREFGMNDDSDIKEIIYEVDSDNVSKIIIYNIIIVNDTCTNL